MSKPVVPLKNIQFLQLNTRSGRGFQSRSPNDQGNADAGSAKDAEKSNVNVGKFAVQQQLTNSDQQLKERQRLINQQNNNNLRILSANLVNLNPNASHSQSKQLLRRDSSHQEANLGGSVPTDPKVAGDGSKQLPGGPAANMK